MSCYVIDLKEYYTVAGILSALSRHQTWDREPMLRIWSWEKHRVLIGEDYIEVMLKAYAINCKNVGLRYHESYEELDDILKISSTVYRDYYLKWNRFAERCANQWSAEESANLKKLVLSVMEWLKHGYSYQSCDDNECEEKSNAIIQEIVTALADVLISLEGDRDKLFVHWTEWDDKPPVFQENEPVDIFSIARER